MTKLSVVVITYNEAPNIARCLQSVQGIADDIVVVDSYSEDATCQIAREQGARVIEHPFEGHIEQKNWAITQAQYPHILSLDADEALDEKLKESVAEIKNNWEAPGYYVNRLTNYCGTWIRHGTWYPDRKLRLWDSRKGAWGGQNPHDRFILHKPARTPALKGNLLHYSFNSVEDLKRQIELFTNISSKAAFENGNHSGYLHRMVKPAFKFVKSLLLKRGFLDGKAGWEIALHSARYTYLKYTKLHRLQREKRA